MAKKTEWVWLHTDSCSKRLQDNQGCGYRPDSITQLYEADSSFQYE